MKIKHLKTLNGFVAALSECRGAVWLESPDGTRYDLRSSFSQVLALGILLLEKGDNLELYFSNKEDERHFMQFFFDFPEPVRYHWENSDSIGKSYQ